MALLQKSEWVKLKASYVDGVSEVITNERVSGNSMGAMNCIRSRS